MKRKLALLLALVTVLSMSACGAKTAESSEADSVNPATDEQTTSTAGADETSKPETTSTTATTPAPETEKPETTTEVVTTVQATTAKPETTTTEPEISVKPVEQVNLEIEGLDGRTELVSGSGITAVATVLQYYGIDATITDLYNIADKYVDILVIDGVTPSPWKKIVFDPQNIGSVYYAPPIVNMANNYLTSVGSDKRAKDVSGTPLNELMKYLERGIPVIIWGTSNGRPAEDGSPWIADSGEKVISKNKMTVYVVKSYTDDNISLIYHVSGIVLEYPYEIVNEMYQSVYSQAIVIE